MSRVILVEKEYEKGLIDALRVFGIDELSGKKVLIKLHMGEARNRWFVDPKLVKIVVDHLKSIGAEPVLFDTVVIYPSPRAFKASYSMVAKRHGFYDIGCPVVIGDRGKNVDGEGFKFEIPREVLDYEYMIVLSHSKGHCGAGYGGAIKNIGMGCVSKKCKKLVHSQICVPEVDEKKCTLCGKCESVCEQKAISVKERWVIKAGLCVGCNECIKMCPNKALNYKTESLCHMLAYASKAATSHMKKILFVNVLLKITKNCDCFSNALPIICDDIGLLASDDMVSIDKASIDLIENKMKKTFKEINSIDPIDQIITSEKIGLGSSRYTLEKT
jgi:uncharacterized protein